MAVQIDNRDAFFVYGYMVETSLSTADQDISVIEEQYETHKPALSIQREGQGHYGLMWYTQDHRYCYLLGVRVQNMLPENDNLCCRLIPSARFAMMEVPRDQSVFSTWGEFFEKVLPAAGWAPDYDHGMFFEYYPEDGTSPSQLWTPVQPI